MKTCFETEIAGFTIMLEQAANGKFWVTYGAQESGHDYYDDAARALGAVIMHAAACEGNLTIDTED